MEIQDLVVQTPALPNDFIAVSADVLRQVDELCVRAYHGKVETDEHNDNASNLLKEITTLEKQIDKNRAEINLPYVEISRSISKAAETALGPLAGAKDYVKKEITKFVEAREKARAVAAVTPNEAGLKIIPPAPKSSNLRIKKENKIVIPDESLVPKEFRVVDYDLVKSAWERGDITPELHTWFRVEQVTKVSSR